MKEPDPEVEAAERLWQKLDDCITTFYPDYGYEWDEEEAISVIRSAGEQATAELERSREAWRNIAHDLTHKLAESRAASGNAKDEWHPASQPPTPEDFKPTNAILMINGGRVFTATKEWLSTRIWEHYSDYHWSKITPPKP